jgi:glycosyltransferase involved in cell wall biosynthesis
MGLGISQIKSRLKALLRRIFLSRLGQVFIWCVIYCAGAWTWFVFTLRERRLRLGMHFNRGSTNQRLGVTTAAPESPKRYPRIVFVSAWFGTDIGGGAEAALLAMARDVVRLHPEIKVEVATTTLKEFAADWNLAAHPEGETNCDGMTVHRFNAVSRDRSFFHFLNGRYLMGGAATPYLSTSGVKSPVSRLSEYYYLRNMIDSPGLLRFLAKKFPSTDAFVFMPYLMGPVISGARIVREKSYVFPCLHDERYAALGLVKNMLSLVYKNLFWVRSERNLCQKLYPTASIGGVVGSQVTIDKFIGDPTRGRQIAKTGDQRFLLYAGRQIQGKGLPDLVSKFMSFKSRHHQYQDLKLVLIGKGDLDYSSNPEIINLGFVSEQEKADVMSAAIALMQPSLYESFSIVMMESWLQKTPVIVDGRCEVTRNHVEDSGGGYQYTSQDQFDLGLENILAHQNLRENLGEAGRNYVLKNYSSAAVVKNFLEQLGIPNEAS